MVRPIAFWLPGFTVFALIACGGSESGFFSDVGHVGSAGASAHAGSTSGSAGSHAGAAGSSSSAGAGAGAGNPGTAGDLGNGGRGEAGNDDGGTESGGESSGGRAGANSGGGSAGSHAGAGGSHAGAGGSGATAGHAGQSGSAGSNQEPTCSDLLKQASEQLEAARSCNPDSHSLQCTGTVKNTCNCQVPVQKSDSAETKAYLNTLKKLDDKNCATVCTAQACKLVTAADCKTSGSDGAGVCTAVSIGPGAGYF